MFAVASTSAFANRFYLGTYTWAPPSKGIYTGVIDPETGELGPLELAAEAESPSFLAFSPDERFVYAAMESKDGAVGAFRVEPDGKLSLLNVQPSGGAGACHVFVDATGKNLLVANYTGGTIACFRILEDGSLGDRTALVKFEGSGPDPDRQKQPHAHAIYADPASRFVYACDLGTDKVWTFAFDPEKGTLTPTDPEAGVVPPGGGPRHFAIHPTLPFAYANNEMGLSVTAFARDLETGVLTPIQTIPTIEGERPDFEIKTAEIEIHPNGKWLYVSSRGDDTLVVYAIGQDGQLTRRQIAPAAVEVPRGFSIHPSGKWLIAGGQKDNRLVVHAIDLETGAVSATEESAEVGRPVSVLFQRKP